MHSQCKKIYENINVEVIIYKGYIGQCFVKYLLHIKTINFN